MHLSGCVNIAIINLSDHVGISSQSGVYTSIYICLSFAVVSDNILHIALRMSTVAYMNQDRKDHTGCQIRVPLNCIYHLNQGCQTYSTQARACLPIQVQSGPLDNFAKYENYRKIFPIFQ